MFLNAALKNGYIRIWTLVSRINSLLVLVFSWDLSTMRKYRISLGLSFKLMSLFSSSHVSVTGVCLFVFLPLSQSPNTALPEGVRWVGCQGSQPHLRRYPCGVWTLFHVLTVQAKNVGGTGTHNHTHNEFVLL